MLFGRVVLTCLIFKTILIQKSTQNLSTNITRHERSLFPISSEIITAEDHFVPRFHLNRPKNRHNAFTSDFYSENGTVHRKYFNHVPEVDKETDRFPNLNKVLDRFHDVKNEYHYQVEKNDHHFIRPDKSGNKFPDSAEGTYVPFGTEGPSSQPLIWQDFPQLINNKLASASPVDQMERPTTAGMPASTSVMSNYSGIVPKFPIFFTNPATGAVYAITEVKNPDSFIEKDGSKIFSGSSSKNYDDGKYTLHCTMVESTTKSPTTKMIESTTKKTVKSTTPIPPRLTSLRTVRVTKAPTTTTTTKKMKTKKKNRKSGKKRTVVRYEDPPFIEAIGDAMDSMYEKFEDVMTDRVVVRKKQPRNITATPFSRKQTRTTRKPTTTTKKTLQLPYSGKRKLTKRAAPATTPSSFLTTAAPNPVLTTIGFNLNKPRPISDSVEDNSYLFFDELYVDDYIDDYDSKKLASRKNHLQTKAKRNRENEVKDDSGSSEEEVDYVQDIFYPIQDAFNSLTERAAGLINLEEDTDSKNISHGPMYTIYNEQSNQVNSESSSWFTSWFQKKDPVVNAKPLTTTTAEPGWFDYWYDEENDEETGTTDSTNSNGGNGSRWFFNWFNPQTTPKSIRTMTTTTTTTTTTTQPPFLSLVNPVQNAPVWLGMLAQNIINSTIGQKSTISPIFANEIPKKISYDSYQILRLHLKDQNDINFIEKYKNSGEGAKLQWLKGPSLRGPTDVVVPPKHLTDFLGTLNYEGINNEVLIFDLGKALVYDSSNLGTDLRRNSNSYSITWKWYHRYDEIIRFLENLQMKNRNLVELIHVGRTYEGRPLVIAKISKSKTSVGNRKTMKQKKKVKQIKEVFIEAGAHGREWIGPASATWIIKELVKIMKANVTLPQNEFIKNTTWYILPVLNPDGYEYSHEYDRLWRKSRSRHLFKPTGLMNSAMAWLQNDKKEKLCFGVDLNRNWDYRWGQKGSSKSPCNEFFAGPNAFSEPETRAVSRFLIDNRKTIKLFISLHAYGQIISYPSSTNTSYNAQKVDDLMEVGLTGLESLRSSGSRSRYRLNIANDMTSSRSGTSDSYAMYEASIPFSYSIDLSDDGVHGFLLPKSFIEPTAKDAFEIIKSMIDYI